MSKPSKFKLIQTGTVHIPGAIIVNVKANYLPTNITNPSKPCTLLCSQILQFDLKGFNSYQSISSQYILSTSYSFSIQIDFGIEPIGVFNLTIGLDKNIANQYFSGVDCS
jgi:hypothetical protein